jgi:uncharacterized membrane protein (DUF106 family)
MAIIELMATYPRTSLVIIGAIVTFISTILMKYLTNQDHLKSIKARQKELQKELKECRKSGDTCRMEEINKEILELTMKMMKASFSIKQILVTFIPFLILFHWIREFYGGEPPILSSWFWWYLGSALIVSTFYRKILKMA